MVDRGGMCEAGVGAAQLGWDVRVVLREAAHMQLVDDRVVPWDPRVRIVAPWEGAVDDHRAGHACRGIGAAARVDRRVVDELALDRTGIRVEQQLVPVVEQALRGIERAVDAEPVALPGADAGDVAVPDVIGVVTERDAGFQAVRVEQAH